MSAKKILHPTDFSDAAAPALEQAVRLALVSGARLDIFHVMLLHSEDAASVERSMTDYLHKARDTARTWSAGTRLEGRDLDIQTTIERGVSAYEGVMDRASQVSPDLIVLGTHGRSGVAKFLLGSEAEKILRHAGVSVMTLGKGAAAGCVADGFVHALVGIDFSADSRRALDAARSMISPSRGRLTLLHAVAPIAPMTYTGDVRSHFDLDPDLSSRVEQQVRQLAGPGPYEVVVTEGPAAAEIMRVAEEAGADAIVVGGRGLSGWERVLVGSVTERVVRFARKPVLTVR